MLHTQISNLVFDHDKPLRTFTYIVYLHFRKGAKGVQCMELAWSRSKMVTKEMEVNKKHCMEQKVRRKATSRHKGMEQQHK